MSRRKLVDARENAGAESNDPVWNRLREIVRALNGCPIIDGRLITEDEKRPVGSGVAFTAGVIRSIPHKLGRKAVGFFEVCLADLPASGSCRLISAPHPQGITSDHYITLRASVSARTAIWVY